MDVPIQEVESSIAPADLATLLDRGLLVRFSDSGCLAGYSVSRKQIMGVGPNDHLDYLGVLTSLAEEARQLVLWAREWAEFRHAQISQR